LLSVDEDLKTTPTKRLSSEDNTIEYHKEFSKPHKEWLIVKNECITLLYLLHQMIDHYGIN